MDGVTGDVGKEELFEHFRFVADRGQGPLRVDKFLVDRIVGTSRNRIQNAADAGYILVNGKPDVRVTLPKSFPRTSRLTLSMRMMTCLW